MMKRKEAERIIHFFTELQDCKGKREAFIKGVLYGFGFTDNPEPSWDLIKKLIEVGNIERINSWIKIEIDNSKIYSNVKREQIELWKEMLKEDSANQTKSS